MKHLLVLITLVLNTACASHPFAKEWDWSTRAPQTGASDGMSLSTEATKKLAAARKQDPKFFKKLDSARSDSDIVVEIVGPNSSFSVPKSQK